MGATTADISIVHDVLSAGEARLHRVSVTPSRAWARIAFLPGYGDHAMRYLEFYKWIAERGVACYAIDFRGNGVSSGKPGYVNYFDEYVEDLGALLKASFAIGPGKPAEFVVAHSHGALVAAVAALKGKLHCSGCVFLSPFFRKSDPPSAGLRLIAQITTHVAPAWQFKSGVGMEMLTRDEKMAEDTRRDPLCLGIATPRWYVKAMKAQRRALARAGEFRLPLLGLIAGADTLVDPAAAEDFVRRAGSSDKTIKIYPEHRHELLREIGREQIYRDIFDWIRARSPGYSG